MNQGMNEDFAVFVGGAGLALAVLIAVLDLVRDGLWFWAIPLVGVIGWREYVFTGMRLELAKLRKQANSD